MEHGVIAVRPEREVTDYGSDPIRPVIRMTNQPKAVLREKQDSKRERIFSIKFIIIIWSTTGKYGKLIHGITLSGGLYPFVVVIREYHKTMWKGYSFIENFQLSSKFKKRMNT